MPTPEPTIPDAAARALSSAYHGNVYIFPDEAAEMLRAALPHLLPGLYIAPLETDHGKPCIWIDDPTYPGHPIPVMTEQEHPRLFAILAALLPDRTEDEEE